ncbi:MAG: hypothetical protein ACFB0A_04765 [Croceivirga sp.]
MQELIVWLGSNLYGLEDAISTKRTGSGDTIFDFILVLTILIVALLGTVFWSILDRNRSDYKKLYYWLTVGVRYYIGLMLINYGLIKVIQLQFPAPSFYRLMETYGESSPMGLAWAFLGFSKGYNIFIGIAEIMAGLLLFRRTMVFGAIITLMTSMNIMAVNYFYDIPVKIVSTHLVLMTLFLLSKDMKRLIFFFFTEVATKLTVNKRQVKNRYLNMVINGFKALLIGYVFFYGFIEVLEAENKYGSKAPKPELYGAYEVNHFTINGDTIPNYKNEKLWKSIAVYRKNFIVVRKFNDSLPLYYRSAKDSLDKKLILTNTTNERENFEFNYNKINRKDLDFNYIFQGDTIYGTAKRLTKDDFLLTSRGFRWISEFPFNR